MSNRKGRARITDDSQRKPLYSKRKLICGVGINDADYAVAWYEYSEDENGNTIRKFKSCPIYEAWRAMIKRCYSNPETNKWHFDVDVCGEWLRFSNFEKWFRPRFKEKYQLDKDLRKGNLKLYSPETCTVIPAEINLLFGIKPKMKSKTPHGVVTHVDGGYCASCRDNTSGESVRHYLGNFKTPEEAHQKWKMRKLEVCIKYLDKYKNDCELVECLVRVRDILEDAIANKKEILSF